MNFTALETFECPDLKCTYVKGMVYRITKINKILAEEWLQAGKIELGGKNSGILGGV